MLVQVRAGESESETQDAMLTNPVWKQSGMAGLSSRGKVQVGTAGTLRQCMLAAAKRTFLVLQLLSCTLDAVRHGGAERQGEGADE